MDGVPNLQQGAAPAADHVLAGASSGASSGQDASDSRHVDQAAISLPAGAGTSDDAVAAIQLPPPLKSAAFEPSILVAADGGGAAPAPSNRVEAGDTVQICGVGSDLWSRMHTVVQVTQDMVTLSKPIDLGADDARESQRSVRGQAVGSRVHSHCWTWELGLGYHPSGHGGYYVVCV